MDPTKGLFRRRPSTASNRSRLHPQSSITSCGNSGASTSAQSCPTSPKHSPGNRSSLGEQRIPEDEEAHLSPTTSTEASAYAASVTAAANQQRTQRPSSITSSAAQSKPARISSAGSRLTGNATGAGAGGSTSGQRQKQQQQQKGGDDSNQSGTDKRNTSNKGGSGSGGTTTNLQRSASTISEFGVRPCSSPAGLHSYTGLVSMPSSVHGSRLDLRDTDKGSAIYLGCSAPRNSNWSLSSRGSSGGSAPPTPVNTPPVSPRHGVRRAVYIRHQMAGYLPPLCGAQAQADKGI